MRKAAILLLVFFCMSITAIQAQGLRFGLKGGINITSVSLNKDMFGTKNVTGYQVGPKVEYQAWNGFGVELGLLYSQKGFAVKVPGMDDDVENDYLDIPLNLKYTFDMPIARPYILFGGYTSFRIGGDKIWQLPREIGGRIKSRNYGSGLNFEAGLDLFNHLQIGLCYSLGLSNNYSVTGCEGDLDSNGKSRVWSITASILF